jgi:cellulose biosynthesis protein BcsQ
MTYTTAAVVGVTGGAGTTRTVLEAAVALAADGADVAVLDAAYATQGLGDYLAGRLDPDLTTLVADQPETPLSAGLVGLDADADASAGTGAEATGRVACCPVRAPFERLARAKSVDAARNLEGRIEEAATAFDHVLVDVPPIAANQAVAAATACERVGLVAPGGDRGADATSRHRERLADLGTTADLLAVVRGGGEERGADVVVPTTEVAFPACLADERYGRAVASLVAGLVDREVTAVGEPTGLFGGVGEMVRRR